MASFHIRGKWISGRFHAFPYMPNREGHVGPVGFLSVGFFSIGFFGHLLLQGSLSVNAKVAPVGLWRETCLLLEGLVLPLQSRWLHRVISFHWH